MKMTGQGVRNLNEGFGPRPKRRFVPDNCTLGIHDWSEWEDRNGGYERIRVCLNPDCGEQEKVYSIDKSKRKFNNQIRNVDFNFEEAA